MIKGNDIKVPLVYGIFLKSGHCGDEKKSNFRGITILLKEEMYFFLASADLTKKKEN